MDQEKTGVKPSRLKTKKKLTPVFDMIEDACTDYSKNIKKFIEVYLRGLVGFIPFFVLGLLFVLLTYNNFINRNFFISVIFIILLFAASLWAIYYGVRIRATMILLVKGNNVSARDSFEQSKKHFWAYVWLSILSTAVISLLCVLLVVPGLIFAIYYLLFNYVYFFEGFKGRMALRRSKELVKGYWWAVCGRLLFVGLLSWLVSFILAIPLSFMDKEGAGFSVYNALLNVIWALIAPIIIYYTYYIFRDLLEIKGESKLEKKPTKKQNIIDGIMVGIVFLIFVFIMLSSAASLSK